ncbi:MAG: winged helix-turn-helix domain-containing protein, partial [Bacteroidales bacterium]|nr:winged helix-turn-helix domain-containing protein [Bacteroidales bacterium]
ILNRSTGKQEEIVEEHFQIGKYRFEYPIRTVFFDNDSVKLSPKEAELLKLLCQHKNNILSRALALESIWGQETYFTKRSMDVFVTKLRKYLKDDPSIEIINIHGEGFRFIVPD